MGLLPNTSDFIPANQAPLRFLFPFEANLDTLFPSRE